MTVFLCTLLAAIFLSAASGAVPCKRGLGEDAPRYISPDVETVNLQRPEDVSWFWERYAADAEKPVLMAQLTQFEGFFPKALIQWESDEYLVSKVGAQAQVNVVHQYVNQSSMTFKAFLEASESDSSLLLRSEMPDSLEPDLHVQDPDIWKFIPCFKKSARSFPFERLLIMSSGAFSAPIISSPFDSVVYSVSGLTKIRLWPPQTSFSHLERHASSSALFSASGKPDFLSFNVTLEKGTMLFIPFLWFRQIVGHCRSVRVETNFDLRGLLSSSLTLYKNPNLDNLAVFQHIRQLKVLESGVCSELVTKVQFLEKHRLWKRNALIATAFVALLILGLIVHFIQSFSEDERRRKQELEKEKEKETKKKK